MREKRKKLDSPQIIITPWIIKKKKSDLSETKKKKKQPLVKWGFQREGTCNSQLYLHKVFLSE